MDKATTEAYLEDIRPSELRLKQVEYLLRLTKVQDDLKGVAWSEKVNTYTTSDTTGTSVARTLDKIADLANERELLLAKLELYYNWISNIDHVSDVEIAKEIYINGHNLRWLSIEYGDDYSTLHKRKKRLIKKLCGFPIVALTEIERIKNKS